MKHYAARGLPRLQVWAIWATSNGGAHLEVGDVGGDVGLLVFCCDAEARHCHQLNGPRMLALHRRARQEAVQQTHCQRMCLQREVQFLAGLGSRSTGEV